MTNGGGHPPKPKRQKQKRAPAAQRPLNQQSLVGNNLGKSAGQCARKQPPAKDTPTLS